MSSLAALDRFAKTPDTMLTDITDKTGQNPAQQSTAPAGSGQVSTADHLKNVVPDSVALGGLDHTKVSTVIGPDAPAAPGSPTTPAIGGAASPLGQMIDAKLAIELMDAMLPAILVLVLAKLKVKLRKTEVQLTEKEKGVLAPLVQQCLNTLSMNFSSPWAALGVTMLVIYGSKVGEKGFTAWMDQKAAKDAQEALKDAESKESKPDSDGRPVELKKAPAGGWPEELIKQVQKAKAIGRDRAIKHLDKTGGTL